MYERHGHTKQRKRPPEYYAWANLIQRCTNSKRHDFHHYGGRGITVCQRWVDSFDAFFTDMGPRPEGTSIDRIDNNRGYEPDNCRWATSDQQNQNTRQTRLITFNGETMGIGAWARKLGMKRETLRERLKKWPLPEAMTIPIATRRRSDHVL